MKARTLACTLLLLAPIGCRSSSSDNPDSGNTNPIDGGTTVDGAGSATVTAIAPIRMTNPVNGTLLEFDNVIVTARVTSSKSGRFWIQDQGGGQYSGIEVFCSFTSTKTPCAMKRADIDALNVGDKLNVVGKFDAFLFSSGTPSGAIPSLEIEQPTVTKVGTGTPTATTVDAAMIAAMPVDASNPWLGTYVKLDAPVTVSDVMPADYSSMCTGGDAGTGTYYQGFLATSGSSTLNVGLGFYKTLYPTGNTTPCQSEAVCGFTSCAAAQQVTVGEMWSGLQGIVESDYSTTEAYIQISPSVPSDFIP